MELIDGLVAGQRLILVNVAGCYVPGGRYAHAASAIMSVHRQGGRCAQHRCDIARPQGRRCQPRHPAHHEALCGADTVLALGGAGDRGHGFWPVFRKPADVIVGPGNRFVAEAKRRCSAESVSMWWRVRTESAIIADDSADANLVAADLAGQAEHGPDSPVWLFTSARTRHEGDRPHALCHRCLA